MSAIAIGIASVAATALPTAASPRTAKNAVKQPHGEADAEKETRKQLGQLRAESERLEADGKLREAVLVLEKAVAIASPIIGVQSDEIASLKTEIARLDETQENWTAARKARAEVLAICRHLHPASDWRVTDARLGVQVGAFCSKLAPRERQELFQTEKVRSQVAAFYQNGEFRRAIPLAKEVTRIRSRVLGAEHAATAESLNDLAALHSSLGDYAKAEPLYQQALGIFEKVLGDDHPATATALGNLAALYDSMGDHAKAEPLARGA